MPLKFGVRRRGDGRHLIPSVGVVDVGSAAAAGSGAGRRAFLPGSRGLRRACVAPMGPPPSEQAAGAELQRRHDAHPLNRS